MEERVTTAGLESTNMTVTAWGTELTPTNGSDRALSNWNKAILTPAVLVFTVALVGLAGNSVVLWLLGFRMRGNAFSVYILNLAGADFLFLCCRIIQSLGFVFNFHFVISVIDTFLSIVSTFAYISGLSFLSAISTERCLSVLWPIWYRCRRPRHMSTIMCALLWALSLLLCILDKNFSLFLLGFFSPSICRVFDFIAAAWLILLFVLLSGSSLALMTRLLCGSNRVPPTRLYMTVLITVLVFLLCGLPFGIYWFIIIWIPNKPSVHFHVTMVVVLLSCVNSCANPIIYFFVGSFRQRWWKQRHTLRLVLQRALQDTPEVDEPGAESLPGENLAMSRTSLGQG